MAIGYESAVVNGQLVNVAPKAGYDPLIWGQAYASPSMWPRQGVYNVPPVVPSGALQASMAPSAYGSSALTGGSGMPTNTIPTATSETGNPFSFTKSPLILALVFLTVGILMLQHIHYR